VIAYFGQEQKSDDALADLVKNNSELVLNGSTYEIHHAMKSYMPDYYQPDYVFKSRSNIKEANRLKRWMSGREVIKDLVVEISRRSSYEL